MQTIIAIGLVLMLVVLICLCVTTKLYSGTENRAGKIAAVVFTFLQVVV